MSLKKKKLWMLKVKLKLKKMLVVKKLLALKQIRCRFFIYKKIMAVLLAALEFTKGGDEGLLFRRQVLALYEKSTQGGSS